MSISDIFKSVTGTFRTHSDRANSSEYALPYTAASTKASATFILCNDISSLHRECKSIGGKLRASGHDINYSCVKNEEELLDGLNNIKQRGEQLPDAFFLDVGGVGEVTAIKVIKWFEKNYPDNPLPEINFLSLAVEVGIGEAGRMRRSDDRIQAGFVDCDELTWLNNLLNDKRTKGYEPVSKTFREYLNRKLGTSLPLDYDDSSCATQIKNMMEITNDRVHDAWRKGTLSSEQAIERMRNYSIGLAASLRDGLYAHGSKTDGIGKDAAFYCSTGFPVKGPVVFSIEDAENAAKELNGKPILVMQSYDPAMVPLLAKGILGGLVVASPYMASHLKMLCETHMVSGLFGLVPPGKGEVTSDFNEEARPDLPPYFTGTAEIAGEKLEKGQTVLIGLGGDGMNFEPPNSLGTKPLDSSSIKYDSVIQSGLKNLRNVNDYFTDFFAGKNLPGIKANISSVDDPLLEHVSGIGLVRTEQMVAFSAPQRELIKAIFLHDDYTTCKKLFEEHAKQDYSRIIRKMDDGKPVKIRLFDFVHREILDKEEQKEFVSIHGKMDIHGGEALAAWPNLYREQARAILAAFKNADIRNVPIEIMMPAVRTEKDTQDIKNMIYEEALKAGVDKKRYRFGVMVETLESCENISAIAKHCDFISFGTNDLTQQSFGLPRNDLKTQARFAAKNGYNPLKTMAPEILDLIKTMVMKARAVQPALKIDVCGEQAADFNTAISLYDAGIDNISVAPTLGNLYGLQAQLNYHAYDTAKSAPATGAAPSRKNY